MPYKIGGGGMPELYDPDNGQYTDEQKNKLLEGEISNIVLKYIFGLDGTFDPRYPIYGFHSDEYCELYVKYRISNFYKNLSRDKIKYLLTFRNKNDKSNFFRLLGYELNESDTNSLFKEIMDGSNFAKMKFNKLNQYGLFVKVPTKIRNKKTLEYVFITTIWKYTKDGRIFFITAIPKEMENRI